jgi:hypothetical protein
MGNGQMRLDEIISENMLIIALHKVPISYEIEFNVIIKDLDIFLRLKGARLQRFIGSNILDFKSLLQKFLSIQFYDESDPDIIAIKDRCREMISIIDNKIKTGK